MPYLTMPVATTGIRLAIRRDTASQWSLINPVLLDGEIGYEKDTGKMKIGDGVRAWKVLPYFVTGGGGGGGSGASGIFDGGAPDTVFVQGRDARIDCGGVV